MSGSNTRVSHAGDKEYRTFLRSAEDAVCASIPRIEKSIETGRLDGSWHPNGFATFKVEFVPDLGLIRLHVWAQGMRPSVPSHPDIHCHSFHLYSQVLLGTYRENQFTISEMTDLSRAPRTFHAYRVQPTGREGPDILHRELSQLVATPIFRDDLVFPAGSRHDLLAGVYHATRIPFNDFCATIAVLGRHLPGVSDVLIADSDFNQLNRNRARLTAREVEEVCRQISAERTALAGQ